MIYNHRKHEWPVLNCPPLAGFKVPGDKFMRCVRAAVDSEKLKEPFSASDVKKACPDFADHTYSNFLPKHRKGNPGGYTEYFERVAPGLYILI